MREVTLEAPPKYAGVSPTAPQEHLTGYAFGPSGYTAGCRCEWCVEGRRRYHREWARKRRKGIRSTVDAREARQSIKYIMKRAGLTYPEISRRSGIGPEAVRKIATGRTKRIRPETLEAILGVDTTLTVAPCMPVEYVLPLLNAIHDEAGMTWRQIASALGQNDPNWIWGVRNRRKYIYGRSFRKIFVLYRLLAREGRVPNAPLARLLEVMAL